MKGNDLPEGWSSARLGGIAEIVSGQTPTGIDRASTKGGQIAWFRIADMNASGNELLLSTAQVTLSHDAVRQLGLHVRPAGTIVFPKRGGAIATNKKRRLAAPAAYDLNIMGVVPPAMLNDYFWWWFQTLDLAQLGDGTAVPQINHGDIAPLDVPIAPLNEQRRIVAKIEALMARSRRTKEALEAIPALLDQLRQSILAAAFRGDLTADWRERHPDVEPASELLKRIRVERRRRWEEAELGKMKAKGKVPGDDRWKARYEEPEGVDESELPELPEGWGWASIEQVTAVVTVGHVGPMQNEYANEGVPFLRSQNVRANRFNRDGLKFIGSEFHRKLWKSRLAPGDVVVVRSGEPGTSCVVPDDVPEANCADLLVVRPLKPIDPPLLAMYFNASALEGRVRERQVGMAQQHFNVGAIRRFPVPIIPAEEATHLVRVLLQGLHRIDSGVMHHTVLIEGLGALDSSILAKAFRGELVPQDPNDEPASVLLERIRAGNRNQSSNGRRWAR